MAKTCCRDLLIPSSPPRSKDSCALPEDFSRSRSKFKTFKTFYKIIIVVIPMSPYLLEMYFFLVKHPILLKDIYPFSC